MSNLIYDHKRKNSLKIELLAPAGSFETLQAAINAGADAVYFGVGEMNMRATAAKNFQLEDLPEIVTICKKSDVKTYVTLNTVLYNEELEKAKKIIDKVKKAGVDAIIAADVAAIMYAREQGVEVHISTQLSVSNTENVKFYSQYADRVVLARELNLKQIKKISQDIKKQNIRGPKGELVELEAFAHGALCVAVSGRCAMSLYCYNRSANRGQCAQICRRRFKVTDIETGKELIVDNNYVMSSADLCTIGLLPEMLDAGISIFKIEGRGRPAEYVDTVIRTYKSALQTLQNAPEKYTDEQIKEWTDDLKSVYNRGFTQGFYMGRKLDEWAGVHGSKATEEKTLFGVVEHYYPKAKIAQVKIQAGGKASDGGKVAKGDKFYISGSTTGIVKGTLTGMQVNDKEVSHASQNDVITFQLTDKVRKNDKFFIVRKRTSLIPRGREKSL